MKTRIIYFKKIFRTKNMSLLLMATPGSMSLTAFLEALVANTPIKALVMPLMVVAVSFARHYR